MTPSMTRFTVFSIVVLLTRAPLLDAAPTDGATGARRGGVMSEDSADHSGHAACPFATAPTAAGELPDQVPQRGTRGSLGQDAFAALAEMRILLTADPSTDWVDLDALRKHLVDMNRVVLDAEVSVRPVPGGFEARVAGTGRTLDAIRRMVPAHARLVDGRDGLRVAVSTPAEADRPEEGLTVRVTTAEASAVAQGQRAGLLRLSGRGRPPPPTPPGHGPRRRTSLSLERAGRGPRRPGFLELDSRGRRAAPPRPID